MEKLDYRAAYGTLQAKGGGMKTEYQYIRFVQVQTPIRKTSVWTCRAIRSGTVLGLVSWHGAWRSFCFFPEGGTVFSTGCLVDVQHFIQQLMDARKKRKAPCKLCMGTGGKLTASGYLIDGGGDCSRCGGTGEEEA